MRKNTLILLAIFVILLLVFTVSKITDRTTAKASYFINVDTTRISKIHIISPDKGEVTLSKASGLWRVVEPIDYAADERNVGQTISKLGSMEIESLVSGRKDQQTTYEVDSSGTLVELFDGDNKLEAFYLGKNAPTYRHNYMRKVNSNDIVMVKGSYRYQFSRNLKDWRDKIILELERSDISDMEFKYPDEEFSLTFVDTTWVVSSRSETFTADSKKVDQVLNYLGKLRTGDFFTPEEGEEPDWSKPEFTLVINLKGNISETIMLWEKPDKANQYLLKLAKKTTVFVVYKGTQATLMKKLDDFRPPTEETTED